MTTTCEHVRALLEEHDLEGLQKDEAARNHAADCEQCFALLEALGEVDRALAALPLIDAPDALIEKVLSAPKPPVAAASQRPLSKTRRFSRRLLGGSAIAATLLIGLFSTTMIMTARAPARDQGIVVYSAPEPATIELPKQDLQLGKGEHTIVLQQNGYVGGGTRGAKPSDAPISGREAYVILDGKKQRLDDDGRAAIDGSEKLSDAEKQRSQLEVTKDELIALVEQRDRQGLDRGKRAELEPEMQRKLERVRELTKEEIEEGATASKRPELPGWWSGTVNTEIPPAEHGLRWSPGFLRGRDQLEGLTFQPAEGYWQNTYTPGDPTFRLLASRLNEEGIEDQARPYAQPFDAPKNAALSLSIASDRAAVEGPARVLLQVGLEGALEHGRRRPTMNIALVVDAGGSIDVETAKAIRSVVMSFAQSKVAGDRMALFLAGRPGAKWVEPKRFEYGAVAVAMQGALSETPAAEEGEAITTTEALRRAIELVAGADDETAPLGASAVVLIAHRPIGMELERISDMAHQSAVAGIAVSVVGVGANAVLPELERIALDGQGNRRLLSRAEEAEALVDRELASVSRVVARAVRLRIRLASGVKLVGVLGSRRLDTRESHRVREAERSIDLRLSKHLGIEADRGEDEDGIQIVIPSYYASDEHPILLDLVVPGPGPVADVQVRYKDLVYLKNGVARARLELRRGRTERGPLQLAVLKNLLSRQISDALTIASRRVAQRDIAGAEEVLAASEALLSEMSKVFVQDRELARDAAMIARYKEAIGAPDQRLVDSMQFASKAKILPVPPTSQR